MAKFQPSNESLDPVARHVAHLRYLQKASALLEQHLVEDGEVPHWVQDRIAQAVASLGMAVTYVSRREHEKNNPPKKSAKSPKPLQRKK